MAEDEKKKKDEEMLNASLPMGGQPAVTGDQMLAAPQPAKTGGATGSWGSERGVAPLPTPELVDYSAPAPQQTNYMPAAMPMVPSTPTPNIVRGFEQGERQAAKDYAYEKGLVDAQMADQQRELDAINKKRSEIEGFVGNLNQEMEAVSAQKPDTDFWGRKTTGEKILAGIALALGAIGARNTGVNAAASGISRSIETDLQNQIRDIEGKKDALKEKKSIYATQLAALGNREAAIESTRAHLYNRAQGAIRKYDAMVSNAKDKASLAAMDAKFEMQKQQSAQNAANEYLKMANYEAASRGMNVDPKSLGEDERERYIQGYGFANTRSEGTTGRKLLSERLAAKDAINKIVSIRKDKGFELFPTAASTEAASAATDLLLTFKNMAQLGVLSKSDEEILNKLVPKDPTGFSYNVIPKMKAAEEFIERKWEGFLKSQGIKKDGGDIDFSPSKGGNSAPQGGGYMKVNN